jgi:hypothetical protein
VKRILLFVSLLFLFASLSIAQSRDTLFYGDTPELAPNPYSEGGWIAGVNGYGDIGKYQRFDFVGTTDYIIGAQFYFGINKIVNDPDSIWFVIRDTGSDSGPGEILSSVLANTSVIDTDNIIATTIWFTEPVQIQASGFIPDSLFIGFEWPDSNTCDDTFAVYQDPDGFGDGANRPWERFIDGAFNDFTDIIYNPDYSWLIDTDLWISAITSDTPVDVEDEATNMPSEFKLAQNYPNPFNPATRIEYSLPEVSNVKLTVFDILGNEISVLLNEEMQSGDHFVNFDASGLANGIYMYKLDAGNFVQTKKMILLK